MTEDTSRPSVIRFAMSDEVSRRTPRHCGIGGGEDGGSFGDPSFSPACVGWFLGSVSRVVAGTHFPVKSKMSALMVFSFVSA